MTEILYRNHSKYMNFPPIRHLSTLHRPSTSFVTDFSIFQLIASVQPAQQTLSSRTQCTGTPKYRAFNHFPSSYQMHAWIMAILIKEPSFTQYSLSLYSAWILTQFIYISPVGQSVRSAFSSSSACKQKCNQSFQSTKQAIFETIHDKQWIKMRFRALPPANR